MIPTRPGARPASECQPVMSPKGRRIFAGIAWVIAGLVAWGIVCNVFGYVFFVYLGNERGVKLPAWSADAFNWIAIGGGLLIPAFVAVLAIRAYLPGTGTRRSNSRGFEVEPSRPSGAA